MERASAPEPRPRRRRRPTRRGLLARRVGAVALAALATAAVWASFFRDEGSDGDEARRTRGGGISGPVAELVRELTPAERVDQLLLAGFAGTDATAPLLDDVRQRQLGGVLVAAPNWSDPVQGEALIGEVRAAAREAGPIPPLVATAQEGGEFAALAGIGPAEHQLDLGNGGDPAAVERAFHEAAAGLAAAGVDLNLAPLADIATIASPLAGRAFSDDPALVAELTAAALRGCAEGGIACAPLHFPGEGGASQDTAEGPATVSLDAASLRDRELAPFRVAFRERAPAVVVSLAFFAAYDAVTPAALAPAVTTRLLRRDLGYEGVAITDDLSGGAVEATTDPARAAVDAVVAGADMVQVGDPADRRRVEAALGEAADSGEIPTSRLSEAAGRVLELKRKLGLLEV